MAKAKTKTKRKRKEEEDGEMGEEVARNRKWNREGTAMVWLRVTPAQRDRMDGAVRAWNAGKRVVEGREPRLTRTGLILDAVDAYLPRLAGREQLELPAVKRG